MADATTLVLGDTGDRTEVVIVDGDVTVVSQAADATTVTVELTGIPIPGPQGPAGPVGSGGAASAPFEHPVMAPDDDYIVTHNRGVDPANVVFVQAGVVYSVYWQIVTPGVSIRVAHGTPMTGKAILAF